MKCSKCKKRKKIEWVSFISYKKTIAFLKMKDIKNLLGNRGIKGMLKRKFITPYCQKCGQETKMVEEL